MTKKLNQPRGFTLLELLVVISIIGLLSTLALVALGSARGKARDAQRVSNIKQIQTALELFFNDSLTASYPTGTGLVLGSGSAACLEAAGFAPAGASGCPASAYMKVPPDPQNTGLFVYTYTQGSSSYSLTFRLEGSAGGLASGSHTATPGGIQ